MPSLSCGRVATSLTVLGRGKDIGSAHMRTHVFVICSQTCMVPTGGQDTVNMHGLNLCKFNDRLHR